MIKREMCTCGKQRTRNQLKSCLKEGYGQGGIGYTLRKPRRARRAFQWNPQGQRKRGRPKNTWRRGVEQEMKEAGVTWGSLEASAQDRVKW